MSTEKGLISKALLDLERFRNDLVRWRGVHEPGAMETV
jgi:hypothetical protein